MSVLWFVLVNNWKHLFSAFVLQLFCFFFVCLSHTLLFFPFLYYIFISLLFWVGECWHFSFSSLAPYFHALAQVHAHRDEAYSVAVSITTSSDLYTHFHPSYTTTYNTYSLFPLFSLSHGMFFYGSRHYMLIVNYLKHIQHYFFVFVLTSSTTTYLFVI